MGGIEISPKKTRKWSSHLLSPLLPRPTQPTGWLTSGGTRPSRSSTSPQTTGAPLPPPSTQSITPNGNHSGNSAMALFDGDSDGKLNAEELSEWKAKIQELMAQWGWNPTSDTKACLRNAWTAANKNGNINDATRQEIALFTLGTWNCMLQ